MSTTDTDEFFANNEPTGADVKEFLEAAGISTEDAIPEPPKEENAKTTQESKELTPVVEMTFGTSGNTQGKDADELVPVPDPMKNLMIPVRDDMIPITDLDKELYLKATLNDVPVILDIPMANGITITVRSLSTYEGDLAVGASIHYLKEHPEYGLARGMGAGLKDQYLVSMQVMKVNGNPVDYLQFKYEPGVSDLVEDTKKLYNRGNAALFNTAGPRYGLFVRAINVFNLKIERLQNCAFSQDFWYPGNTD